MKAFKGDKNLKQDILKEITKHEKADAIIQGHYGEACGCEPEDKSDND